MGGGAERSVRERGKAKGKGGGREGRREGGESERERGVHIKS